MAVILPKPVLDICNKLSMMAEMKDTELDYIEVIS